METSEISLAATIMRNIWLRRNDIVFNNSFQSPLRIIQITARVELEEFLAAQESVKQGQS